MLEVDFYTFSFKRQSYKRTQSAGGLWKEKEGTESLRSCKFRSPGKPNCPVKGNRMRQKKKKAAATCPHWLPDAFSPQAFGDSTQGSHLLHTGSWYHPPRPQEIPQKFSHPVEDPLTHHRWSFF